MLRNPLPVPEGDPAFPPYSIREWCKNDSTISARSDGHSRSTLHSTEMYHRANDGRILYHPLCYIILNCTILEYTILYCIKQSIHSPPSGGGVVGSVVNFVDLAGSERLARSQSEGRRFQEAVIINSSLSAPWQKPRSPLRRIIYIYIYVIHTYIYIYIYICTHTISRI